MSSISKSQAEIDAQIAHDALTAAANTRFITAADLQIQEAINLGKFWIECISSDDIDPQVIFQYYADLGYGVSFPDYPVDMFLIQGPANLFGDLWVNYWANSGFMPSSLKKPYRFMIYWK